MKIKKAAVIIEAWKLNIFNSELRAAGFTYRQYPGPVEGTLNLQTDHTDATRSKLEETIKKAQAKCILKKVH